MRQLHCYEPVAHMLQMLMLLQLLLSTLQPQQRLRHSHRRASLLCAKQKGFLVCVHVIPAQLKRFHVSSLLSYGATRRWMCINSVALVVRRTKLEHGAPSGAVTCNDTLHASQETGGVERRNHLL